jgi:uncharacterized protein (DUF952 family)
MPIIYHITTVAEWDSALQSGAYEARSLKEEGFIHCSEAYQVEGVLQRYFEGQTRLVKLVIDTDKLTSQYIQEWSSGSQDTFPHIYGPINLDAVLMVEPMTSQPKAI